MDIYRKDEEKDVQNKTGPDQGGFIELTSHKTTKENTGKSSYELGQQEDFPVFSFAVLWLVS